MKNEVDEGGGELSPSLQCERSFGSHQRAPMHAGTNAYAHMHAITEEGLMLSVLSLKRKDRERKLQKDGGWGWGGLLRDQVVFVLFTS